MLNYEATRTRNAILQFRLLATYGVVSERMRATLAAVEDVPVDIRSYIVTDTPLVLTILTFYLQAHIPEGLLDMDCVLDFIIQ